MGKKRVIFPQLIQSNNVQLSTLHTSALHTLLLCTSVFTLFLLHKFTIPSHVISYVYIPWPMNTYRDGACHHQNFSSFHHPFSQAYCSNLPEGHFCQFSSIASTSPKHNSSYS
ncbi:hypothetical protein Pint_33115 [Pistacia integerrima]|uniref:Uncharacterized protein n=1 Tax=Pistacia integerrima TaxID=434235 RepID=A0ACC0X5S1_9ROSI|nr:hypothetical protein Pint_33115 [Pistacia integerrima]